MYEKLVKFAKRTIRSRGHIWEGARKSIELEAFYNPDVQKMIDKKIIVPHPDPSMGYILPKTKIN